MLDDCSLFFFLLKLYLQATCLAGCECQHTGVNIVKRKTNWYIWHLLLKSPNVTLTPLSAILLTKKIWQGSPREEVTCSFFPQRVRFCTAENTWSLTRKHIRHLINPILRATQCASFKIHPFSFPCITTYLNLTVWDSVVHLQERDLDLDRDLCLFDRSKRSLNNKQLTKGNKIDNKGVWGSGPSCSKQD